MPFVPPAAATLALVALWQRLPSAWVVHWNAAGQPDGYAGPSVAGVFSMIFMSVFLAVLLEGIATAMQKWLSRERPVLIRYYADGIRWINLGISMALSAGSLALPFLQPPPLVFVAGVFACIIWGTFMMVWHLRGARQAMAAAGESLPAGYGVFFYKNADDPRLWVPKIAGIGHTLNFAHRRAYFFLGFLLLVPVVLAAGVAAFCGGAM
jgi:hypothetical protein